MTLLSYVPFAALLYALFALIQALRHRRQGIFAALFALLVAAASLAVYLLVTDTTVRAGLANTLPIAAGVAFLASLLVLMIERRSKQRAPNRSYGMVGIGLGVALAAIMLVAPLLATTATSSSAVPTFTNTSSDGTTVLASFNSSSVLPQNTAADSTAADTTQQSDSTPTAVGQAITAQTGLSPDDALTKINAGSTIADLVTASSGDLNAVISAIAAALDDMNTSGGMQAQMISSLGTDTTDIATQLANGTLGQAQQFLLPQLITGQMPTPPNGQGGAPPSGDSSGSFAPPSDTTSIANAEGTATPVAPQSAPAAVATEVPATAEPTEVTVRPTRIVFPTAEPTTEAAEVSTDEATDSTGDAASVQVSDSTAVCTLVIDYNLNLRDQPTTDGSTVLLSIPFGSSVTTDSRTADGWYHVTYAGDTGWVSGQYVTASSACASLPQAS